MTAPPGRGWAGWWLLVWRRIPRIDHLRIDTQQLGDLLDHHRQHHRLEIRPRLAPVLDRPPEQDEPGRRGATAAHERGEGDGPRAPVVGNLGRVLDGVLDQAEPVLPPPVDVGDDVEDEVVEPLPRRTSSRPADGS